MKRRVTVLSIVIVISFALAACARGGQSQAVEEEAAEAMPPFPGGAAPAAEFDESFAGEVTLEGSSNQLPAGQERLIIRTADMSIVATDTE